MYFVCSQVHGPATGWACKGGGRGGGGWGVGLEAAVCGIANKLSVRKLWFYVLESLSSNDGDGDENVT